MHTYILYTLYIYKKRKLLSLPLSLYTYAYMYVCICVFVCVKAEEGSGERERGEGEKKKKLGAELHLVLMWITWAMNSRSWERERRTGIQRWMEWNQRGEASHTYTHTHIHYIHCLQYMVRREERESECVCVPAREEHGRIREALSQWIPHLHCIAEAAAAVAVTAAEFCQNPGKPQKTRACLFTYGDIQRERERAGII